MAQLNLYIDPSTDTLLTKASRKAKLSKSAYVRLLVKQALDASWPSEVTSLVGAWKDFPSLQAVRAGQGRDLKRERL